MKYLYLIIFLLSSCSIPNKTELLDSNIIKIAQPIDKIIEDSSPSFDGNEQNSGIIDYDNIKGWQISKNALVRYNFLISKYGSDYIPALSENYGIIKENNLIYLNNEGMVKFGLMNQKYKHQ